jgi:hypothetical protein
LLGGKHEIVHGVFFGFIGREEGKVFAFDHARGAGAGVEGAGVSAFAQDVRDGHGLEDVAGEGPAGEEESSHGLGAAWNSGSGTKTLFGQTKLRTYKTCCVNNLLAIFDNRETVTPIS